MLYSTIIGKFPPDGATITRDEPVIVYENGTVIRGATALLFCCGGPGQPLPERDRLAGLALIIFASLEKFANSG